MPLLRGFAGPGAGPGAGNVAIARAWGVNAYTYTGTSSFELELGISLTGLVQFSGDNGWGQILANVYVVDANVYESFFSGTTDAGGAISDGLIDTIDEADLYINNRTIGGQLDTSSETSATIAFTVQPDSSFYLWASLLVQNANGNFSFATNSLTMSFNETENLTAASSQFGSGGPGQGTGPTPDPIPEPGTIALLGIGLVGLGLYARRRRTMV
ncbi:PEP-CTERM sorting domain-containing protein [Desulfonatronum thioautotrophicum]|uniref:PEP-CTERM sorting domain-containing protein n=1 Tax=Desulfonatronum thioautotrophicum TaxID=617001 RepID=UPI0005EBEA68|nr:PEP-CTERM sorting domain-containing protein [Desulfonatronum thioautotrophicum]